MKTMNSRKKIAPDVIERDVAIPPDHPGFDEIDVDDVRYDRRRHWSEYHDVGSGAWVFIASAIPVKKSVAPQRFYIYWGVPAVSNVMVDYWDDSGKKKRLAGTVVGRDQFCRQAIKVLTSEEVTLFTDEYSVVPPERLELYRQDGYEMVPIGAGDTEEINIELIEKGRTLVEEEREIIWALMIDGLSESQACSEYFFGRHIDVSNRGFFYRPSVEIQKWLEDTFG